MRISGIAESSFYWRNVFVACPTIILDGALVKHVIEADDSAGAVEIMVYKSGKPKVRNGHFVTKVLRGQVEIVGRKCGDPTH